MSALKDDDANGDGLQALLDWSSKQSRILTADGLASNYYHENRGCPFKADELPHHHLLLCPPPPAVRDGETGAGRSGREPNSTYRAFRAWSRQRLRDNPRSPIIGAWCRPVFTGTWEHSTSSDEDTYNIQTGSLFVDIRIPTARPGKRFAQSASCLGDLSDEDLKAYARQHAFGGYSLLAYEPYREVRVGDDGKAKDIRPNRPVCTRHHCLDWNLVPGRPRNRPNKWWIELPPPAGGTANVWKEWSYATDERNQHYYMERWERLDGDGMGKGVVLALRKVINDNDDESDGILVVVGDHFNYINGPSPSVDGRRKAEALYPSAGTVIELVDAAIDNNDRATAESCLCVDGGHGTISSGWRIDASVRPWREGRSLVGSEDTIRVGGWEDGGGWEAVRVVWNGMPWEVLECSGIRNGGELERFFADRCGASTQGGSRL